MDLGSRPLKTQVFSLEKKQRLSLCGARVLIIGRSDDLIADLPQRLTQVGFFVDILVPKWSALRLSRFVQKAHFFLDTESLLKKACQTLCDDEYRWVIIGDDITLGELLQSSIDEAAKEKLLPVISKEYFYHLYSKIGFSECFKKHNLPTPPFKSVQTIQEAKVFASEHAYPIMVKVDQSGGGWGVHLCQDELALEKLSALFNGKNLLVQTYVKSRQIGINALYLDAKLIHFDYSSVEKHFRAFGVSIVRKYKVQQSCDKKLKNELEQIGKALGAHGFVNITCLEDESTGERFYIEADMRPTAWSTYYSYLSAGFIRKIQAHFSNPKDALKALVSEDISQDHVIPHYLRLRLWEILINRYRVWRYMPWRDFGMMLALLIKRHLVIPLGHQIIRRFPKKMRRPMKLAFQRTIIH